ncbi:MAG: tetratricopeptide (TPR) repeat protein [Pseudohongiellaceae bacterium]|jgi:tetratricopeptide (TPR) repeat protein
MVMACSGLVGKGDKLYELGLYSEAADYYQRALQRDSDNVDAQLGLSRARYKIIDRGLIEVRMLRLASNSPAAAQQLEKLLRDQQAWNVELHGAVTLTQAEETRYAKNWLLKEAHTLANADFPDAYRWFEYAYSHLIANAQIGDKLSVYKNQLSSLGDKKCQNLTKVVKGQGFFLAEFVYRYCSSWGRDVSLATDASDVSRYKRLRPHNHVQHSTRQDNSQNENLRSHLTSLNDVFRGSLWYSPIGLKDLDVDVEGRVDYQHSARRTRRVANYTTENSVTKKSSSGEETTRVETTEKTYPYNARVHSEKFVINVSYSSMVTGQTVKQKAYKVKRHTSEAHDEDFPAANLSPQAPDMLNLHTLFSGEISRLNTGYITALNAVWVSEYCEKRIADGAGEGVLRCAKISPENTYVNNWFSQNFGIDYRQMVELYGI